MTQPLVATAREMHAHALGADEVARLLDVDVDTGLTAAQAATRIESCGPNVIQVASRTSRLRLLMRQFRNPMIYVLLAAALATLAIGQNVDSAVIFAVVLVNAVIGYIQEARAARALEALADLTTTQAEVIRDGMPMRIPSRDVVPGDLVVLDAGDQVPADLRLTRVHDVRVDEAALTGESVPVHKQSVDLTVDTPLADRVNMAFSGTFVTAGRARGICVATGQSTQIGLIQSLVESASGVDTPLQRRLARFSRWLTVIILILAAFTFVVGLLRGESAGYMVTAAVALAVGAIPEGLPAVVTVTLAIGVSRMARRRALIRHLPAVEALGSVTVICTDKTGTLTQNQMQVQSVYVSDEWYDTADPLPSESLRSCLLAGVMCNDASVGVGIHDRSDNVGDPMELALIAVAADVVPDVMEMVQQRPRIQEIPFSSELRYMATLHDLPGETERLLVVKGASEEVAALCVESESDRMRIEAAVEEAADRALRVIAFAWAKVDRDFALTTSTLSTASLEFLGLQAMSDPPRPEAIQAVAACRRAGIRVIMITGDHQRTAQAIAGHFALHDPVSGESPRVLTGRGLELMGDDQLGVAVRDTDVFARVTAEQKLDIVLALQAQGHVAAMTGDGVNDAPALKQADIGIAMGQDGTEVARETSDMVLTDDNFATIEAAVEEGRGVYDNLTKFITWTLPTNIAEGLVILVAVILGSVLPILPVQILWINMTSAITLGLMLSFEPNERDIMRLPPRPPEQQIVTRALVLRILLVGAGMVVGAFGIFTLALEMGAGIDVARTMAVSSFFAMKVGYLFNCRSLRGSVRSVGLFSNPWIWVGISLMVTLQLILTYVPFMNAVFQTAPIPLIGWLPILALTPVTFGLVGVLKWWEGARHQSGQS
jgi:cation-transporting P-type ATPase F